jgi:hypothetical protein
MEQVRRVPDQAPVAEKARVVAAKVAVVVVSGPEAGVAVEREVIDGKTPVVGGSEIDRAGPRPVFCSEEWQRAWRRSHGAIVAGPPNRPRGGLLRGL